MKTADKESINIQSEVQKIHAQYGTTEMANYRIEQLFYQFLGQYKADQGDELRCVAGCQHFTGGEIRHHKDCPHYLESFSSMYDTLKADQPQSREELRSELVKFTFYMKSQFKFINSIEEEDIDEYLFRNPSK